MKREVIVFDFDKTLTVRDTIFGFYRAVSGSSALFFWKRMMFLAAAVLSKTGLVSNDRLKQWGAALFLNGFTEKELQAKGNEYASEIEMNGVFEDQFRQYPAEQVIVISASYEEYLKPLFPECRVAGTQILYDKNRVASGIRRNLYGEEKRRWLAGQAIEEISVLYTDSYSDKPLMDIAGRVFLVEGNLVNEIKAEASEVHG
jgi:phosphoserine phosphatase